MSHLEVTFNLPMVACSLSSYSFESTDAAKLSPSLQLLNWQPSVPGYPDGVNAL